MTTTFHAWVCPAAFTASPVDHTWVTTFDNRNAHYGTIDDVPPAENYWFCWGDYHPRGESNSLKDGLLGTQVGTIEPARCIAAPNKSSVDHEEARGSIFLYGLHGVCHQIANQVLFATRSTGPALLVERARAYRVSEWFWATYGRNRKAWRSRILTCAISAAESMTKSIIERASQDRFAKRAAKILSDRPARLQGLMELREAAWRADEKLAFAAAPLNAEIINASNWEVLQEAAARIGADDFRTIFEHEPGEYLELVDPATFEAQAGERLQST